MCYIDLSKPATMQGNIFEDKHFKEYLEKDRIEKMLKKDDTEYKNSKVIIIIK